MVTQPVKMQQLIDEFGYDGTKVLSTQVKTGSVLAQIAIDSPESNTEETKKFPNAIGILLHVVRHLRHDCIYPTRECSGFMSNVKEACVEHMNDMCKFIVKTKDSGCIIQPDNPGSWDGMKDFLFKISGESDTDWATDPT